MKKQIVIFIISLFIPIVAIPLKLSAYTLGSVTVVTSIIYFLFEYFALKTNDKKIKQESILGLSLLGNIVWVFIYYFMIVKNIDKAGLSMILAKNLTYMFSMTMGYLFYFVSRKYKLAIIVFSLLGYLLLAVTSEILVSQLVDNM